VDFAGGDKCDRRAITRRTVTSSATSKRNGGERLGSPDDRLKGGSDKAERIWGEKIRYWA